MNGQIQHYLESYPVEETISIVRREPVDYQGHEEQRRKETAHKTKRNGVLHLNGTVRRCTSVASLTDAPPLRHEPTHLRCVTKNKETIVSNEERLLPTTTKQNSVPHLDGTTRVTKRRTSVASRKHETQRRTSVASQRSLRTNEAYKRNGVCTYIAMPRTRTQSP